MGQRHSGLQKMYFQRDKDEAYFFIDAYGNQRDGISFTVSPVAVIFFIMSLKKILKHIDLSFCTVLDILRWQDICSQRNQLFLQVFLQDSWLKLACFFFPVELHWEMVTEYIGLKNSVIFYFSLKWKQTFSLFLRERNRTSTGLNCEYIKKNSLLTFSPREASNSFWVVWVTKTISSVYAVLSMNTAICATLICW